MFGLTGLTSKLPRNFFCPNRPNISDSQLRSFTERKNAWRMITQPLHKGFLLLRWKSSEGKSHAEWQVQSLLIFFIKYFSHIDILDKNSLWFTFFCWSKHYIGEGPGALTPFWDPLLSNQYLPLLSFLWHLRKWKNMLVNRPDRFLNVSSNKNVSKQGSIRQCWEQAVAWKKIICFETPVKFSWASKKAFPRQYLLLDLLPCGNPDQADGTFDQMSGLASKTCKILIRDRKH